MNDFLRPCNCVHPAEEDCEKCVEETTVKAEPQPSNMEKPQKTALQAVEGNAGT